MTGPVLAFELWGIALNCGGMGLIWYGLRCNRRTRALQAEQRQLLAEREAAVAVREAAALEFREWGLRSPSHP